MTQLATEPELYRYRIELINDQAQLIAQRRLELADFERAVFEAHFHAFRLGLVPQYAPTLNGAAITPNFAGNANEPSRAAGFCITIPTEAAEPFACDYSFRYFAPLADELRGGHVLPQAEQAETTHYYTLHALLDDGQPTGLTADALELGPASCQTPVVKRRRAELRVSGAWDEPEKSPWPVYVARSLIEQSLDLTRNRPDVETGGLLLGQLCRDPEDGVVYVLVTGLVDNSEHTEGTATTLTFNPESFAAARAMSDLRAAGREPESIIGWLHSHPFRLCAACPLPNPVECISKVLFFSSDDRQLQATTFPQPFAIGLLVAVDERIERALGRAPVRCYGWRNGVVEQRGVFVFED